MKAMIPTRLNKRQKAAIRESVAEEMQRQERGNARRLCKLFCVAYHEAEGAGQKRCMRLMKRVIDLSTEHDHDEVFWKHIDQVLKQIGLEFEDEDYEIVDR